MVKWYGWRTKNLRVRGVEKDEEEIEPAQRQLEWAQWSLENARKTIKALKKFRNEVERSGGE